MIGASGDPALARAAVANANGPTIVNTSLRTSTENPRYITDSATGVVVSPSTMRLWAASNFMSPKSPSALR